MMVVYKPLRDYVLVECDELEEKTSGGLHLSKPEGEKPNSGKVVEIGSGIRNSDGTITPITDIKVGDYVLFSKWSGSQTEIPGEEDSKLKIVKYDDIFALKK